MQYKIHDHLIEQARFLPSPNQSQRPAGEQPSLLVIHNISLPPGEFGGPYIDHLFCNSLDCNQHSFFSEIEHLRVSAHLLIRRDGSVTQYVPFDRKAWHAGKSVFAGREDCNEYSIGIELEGTDYQPFEDIQYESLAGIIRALMQSYPMITLDRMTGHSDIAPGRKTDPGPCFDWLRLRQSLQPT
jgi:N-acetyl-anhydromuramoyl-L-alanine amidase